MLTTHSLAETCSVLTRLPGDARVTPDDAVTLIEANFAGSVPVPEIPAHEPGPSDPSLARKGSQRVWSLAGEHDVPTFERDELTAGMRIAGYAIIEQYDATTVILPDHVAEVDPYLNLLIEPERRP